jgi:hypothetical protein
MPDRTEEILVHLEYLRKGQDETNTHLKTLNGRVGKHDEALAVLKDRGEDAKAAGRNWGAGAGGVAGAFVGGVIAALAAFWGAK